MCGELRGECDRGSSVSAAPSVGGRIPRPVTGPFQRPRRRSLFRLGGFQVAVGEIQAAPRLVDELIDVRALHD
jgi:hypothetical protein